MRVAAVLLIIVKLCAAQDSVIIQHSVFAPCASDVECENVTRLIRSYQMNKKGFTDIGPSFLVGGNGKVYEGAGWSLVGAHTKGYNNRSIGVSFLGDFRQTLPTPEALQAVRNLISCGVEHDFLTQDYRLVGHLQVTTTESPGAALQTEIKSWPHWAENIEA